LQVLIHITSGPSAPDKITLGAMLAVHSAKRGDQVTLFLAANAVRALAPGNLRAIEGTGFGRLETHLADLAKSGARIIVSKLSAQSRGFGNALLPEGAEWGTPDMLLDLAAEADATLCY
jgi:predicted peroxiredoxin